MSVQQWLAVPPNTRVFVDTGAYFALVADEGDRHQTATVILNHLAEVRARLFTTSFVMAEIHALLLARLNRVDLAAELFDGIYTSRTTRIIRPSESDELKALESC